MTLKLTIAAAELRPGFGGIARVSRLMLKALRSHDPHCITLTECDPSAVDCSRLSQARESKLRFFGLIARELVERRRVIYDFAGLSRVHPSFLPYGCWMHGIEAWEGASRHRIEPLRRAHLLLVNSHYTLARAERAFGGFGHGKVCWLATEENDPAPRNASPNGAPKLLTIARHDIVGYKGHAEILALWPNVVKRVPDARWIVAGGGPGLQAFRDQVARSPMGNTIEVRGFVQEASLDALWDETTAFAMPSRGEGFGLVYVEAMRRGVPVIASMQDAGQEVNVDGVTGYNVDLERKDELEERIVKLLTERDCAWKMGSAGVARWQREFSFGAFEARFAEAIREWV